MSPRLVLFDCDGTLVESHEAIATAMRLAFLQHRCSPPSPDRVRSLIGLSAPAMVHVLCQHDPLASEEAILATYESTVRHEAILAASVERPVAGMREVVDGLLDGGTLLGIATGKTTDTLDHALSAFGLGEVFAVRATADEAPSKPAPDLALLAIGAARVPPSRTVVVGDTIFDVLMARAAGARSVGVSWGAHSAENLRLCGADIVVNRPEEIGMAVDRLVPGALAAARLH